MISSLSSASSNPLPTTTSLPEVHGHGRGHHGHGAAKAAAALITSADTDDDGSISQAEFTALIAKTGGGSAPGAVGAKVTELFQQIDTDGDGQISKAELTSALETAHRQVPGQSGAANNPADGLASLLNSWQPPQEAGYDAKGATVAPTNASTFSAVA